ncbi:hypothetical protein OESDEN_00963 [Oesophagostomum dentatum]|uniref:Uncharacterized protein n=1 Tax=Oesophagostomum dentatum TaxID=61180 RepID=A0A0B1TUD6_OESDE|nr:hypothetical protein OESDEN_00963 [Oesophagostomum dentatum]
MSHLTYEAEIGPYFCKLGKEERRGGGMGNTKTARSSVFSKHNRFVVLAVHCGKRPAVESVNVKGQFDVSDADENEEVNSNDAELINDKLFEELASLRIARDYLHRKIAEERAQQILMEGKAATINSKI